MSIIAKSKTGPFQDRMWLISACLASLLFAKMQLFQPAEVIMQTLIASPYQHKASGQIVVIGIDQPNAASIHNHENAYYGKLLDKISQSRPRLVYIDKAFSLATADADDPQLIAALDRAKYPVWIFADLKPKRGSIFSSGAEGDIPAIYNATLTPPSPQVRKRTRLATATGRGLTQMFGTRTFDYARVGQTVLTPVDDILAPNSRSRRGSKPIDIALDVNTIPVIPSDSLLSGKISPDVLNLKTVLIGLHNPAIADGHHLMGSGYISGVMGLAKQAESQLSQPRIQIDFYITFLLTALLLLWNATLHVERRPRYFHLKFVVFLGAAATLLYGLRIHIALADSLILVCFSGIVQFLGNWRARTRILANITNLATGILNTSALASDGNTNDCVFIGLHLTYSPRGQNDLVSTVNQLNKLISREFQHCTLYVVDGTGYSQLIATLPSRDFSPSEPMLISARIKADMAEIISDLAIGVDLCFSSTASQRINDVAEAAARASKRRLNILITNSCNYPVSIGPLATTGTIAEALYDVEVDSQSGAITALIARDIQVADEPRTIRTASQQIDGHSDAIILASTTHHDRATGFRLLLPFTISALSEAGFPDELAYRLHLSRLPPESVSILIAESLSSTLCQKALNSVKILSSTGILIEQTHFGWNLDDVFAQRKMPIHAVALAPVFQRASLNSLSRIFATMNEVETRLARSVRIDGVCDQAVFQLVKAAGLARVSGSLFPNAMTFEEVSDRLFRSTLTTH